MVLITQSDIVDPIRVTAFNPFLTAALALLVRKIKQNPSSVVELFGKNSLLAGIVLKIALHPKTLSTLRVLVGLGIWGYINKYLNQRALNNGYYGPSTQFKWNKEIAVVTGGSGGIGGLIVQDLAKAGFKKVVIMDIVPPTTYQLPSNAVFYKTDLTSGDEISKVGDLIRKEVGHPTIIINNAGTGIGKTILDSTERSIKLTFNVNAVAPFLVTKEFLPNMIENNHGHVVTIASLASFITPAQMVDYCASKAAALSFAEGLSQELKHRYNAPGIRNTVVHPNWVKTPLTTVFKNLDHFYGRQLEPTQVSDAVVKQILSGNSGQVLVPSALNGASFIRGLPNWLQEGTRDNTKDMIVVNKEF